MIDDKNQIIRSMRSYEVGGSTDDSCMEEYMDASGKKRRRRKSKCGKTKTFRVRSTSDKVKLGAKIGAGAAAVIGGIAANKKYGLVGKIKEKLNLKNGGLVKKQKGGTTYRDVDYMSTGIIKTEPRKIGKGTKETQTRYAHGYGGPSSPEIITSKFNKYGDLKRQKTKKTTVEAVDKYVKDNESKVEYKKGGLIKKQMGGPIGNGKFLKNNPKIAAKVSNAKTVIRNVKKMVKPRTKG